LRAEKRRLRVFLKEAAVANRDKQRKEPKKPKQPKKPAPKA
jgi:hypothetical protein